MGKPKDWRANALTLIEEENLRGTNFQMIEDSIENLQFAPK